MTSARPAILTDAEGWTPIASGEARLALSAKDVEMRMDYDFNGGGGFVVARKEVRRLMPDAFEIRFKIRGKGPPNHMEVKLVDDSGKNVWRAVHKDFKPSLRGRELVITSQELEFAWGPAGGGALLNLGAVEFALVAGPGGAGFVSVGKLVFVDLSFAKRPHVVVSSSARGHGKGNLLKAGNLAWRAAVGDKAPFVTFDSGAPRVLGGLVIDWETQAPESGFIVEGSNDGRRWRLLYKALNAGGSRSFVCLPKPQTRHLRVRLMEAAGIKGLHVQPFEFSRSMDAFFHAVAAQQPRGWYPRWLMREQSLWTPAGGLMEKTCSLLNEQGLWEPEEGSFTVEPMVVVNGRLHTWAGVTVSQGLRDGWMPVPGVCWKGKGWRLTVEVTGHGREVCHRFINESGRSMRVRLLAVVRPFQVTPPWQHFRNVGGVSPIHELSWLDGVVSVNGTAKLRSATAGGYWGGMAFDEGCVCEPLIRGELPVRQTVIDGLGYASGVLAHDFRVHAGDEVETVLQRFGFEEPESDDTSFWRETLPCGQLRGHGWAEDVAKTQLTAVAHVLVTQSGPALQPGPRRYTRSWIRDGTTMSAALLRMGRLAEVRAFIEWYVPYQRKDGFVPCCVDREGVDWLVEHDSHGQLIALIWDNHCFAKDKRFLEKLWPAVVRAVKYIQGQREKDGLLPVSVSHEGYLAQPVHSFWDDFWTLRGLRDAVSIAAVLGRNKEKQRWALLAKAMEDSVFAALESTRLTKNLNYIPASREWADFDPTATANAVTLLDAPQAFNEQALTWTFNKYMEDWRRKRKGELPWNNYTAYEIRIIGAMVRLGRRADALELLKFFLSDRRPLEWNQWPEISWADPLSPGHVGDVPHTWIAAEFVLVVRSLFAYESESRDALVLAAGLASEWLDGDGVQVKALPTSFGLLNYRLSQQGKGRCICRVDSGVAVPSGGVVLRPPFGFKRVEVNGKGSTVHKDEVVLMSLPADVVFFR